MQDFTNKVAVVTGAGSGIGCALATELARRGCDLALADVNEVALEDTAEKVRTQGRKASTHKVDVADKAAMQEFARAAAEAHGRINIVINNAGVAVSATVAQMSLEDFEWIVGINFWGMMYGCKFFLPYLQKETEAHIVMLSSLFGLIGEPTQSAYCATKFAVRGFTEAFRAELADSHIGITCVHPGGIDTDIAKNARFHESPTGGSREESIKQFKKLARTSPEKAAEIIVHAIEKNHVRVLVGNDAKFLNTLQRIFPVAYTKLLNRALSRR
jgi:butyryl-CoA dehydrogenase